MAAATGNPIKEVYKAIDSSIGEILSLVDDTTIVVVLAGHRMAHKFGAQFLLPDILAALDVAVLKSPKEKDTVDRMDNLLTWGWQHMPQRLRTPLQGIRQGLRGWIDGRDQTPRFPPSVARLDVANSRCFTMDSGFPVSGIRLNLFGREPQGLIRPGAESDRFCGGLIKDLLEIVDLETGIRMVKEVRRTDDHYHGEYRETLPDLLVAWNDEHRLGSASCGDSSGSHLRLYSDRMGFVEGINHYVRTGDHRPQGMFVAKGPGVSVGQLDRTISIMDFAPTFCEILNAKLPDVDGVPIQELIESTALRV
jgi:predicted AlkP superfamily phosphohydrolase/phosphomutase